MHHLSRVQRDILYLLAGLESPIETPQLIQILSEYYPAPISSTTVYRELNALADSAYITKEPGDDATTATVYTLTECAEDELIQFHQWASIPEPVTPPELKPPMMGFPTELTLVEIYLLCLIKQTDLKTMAKLADKMDAKYNITISDVTLYQLVETLESADYVTETSSTSTTQKATPKSYDLTPKGKTIVDRYTQLQTD